MRNILEREVMIGTQYRVIRVLGRGGSAITYEAEHVETKKRVALKHVTLDALDESDLLGNLQREARALCAIKHPSIPRYLDHFPIETIEGPAFCLIQDLAPGRSLAEWRTQGWHPDESEVKRLAFALLEVLRYLHSLTPPILHGNLNPHNIFREPGGRLWVVDFGAIRDASSTTAPGAGAPVASQGYVAPEQLAGS
ncbi:MAG: protein kinase, partial [Polyangiaceae bacterium]